VEASGALAENSPRNRACRVSRYRTASVETCRQREVDRHQDDPDGGRECSPEAAGFVDSQPLTLLPSLATYPWQLGRIPAAWLPWAIHAHGQPRRRSRAALCLIVLVVVSDLDGGGCGSSIASLGPCSAVLDGWSQSASDGCHRLWSSLASRTTASTVSDTAAFGSSRRDGSPSWWEAVGD
jgi:hypothetical protein